jgi:hypothetical protein
MTINFYCFIESNVLVYSEPEYCFRPNVYNINGLDYKWFGKQTYMYSTVKYTR